MNQAYNSNKKELIESGYNLEKFFEDIYYDYLAKNRVNTTELAEFLTSAIKECPESIDLNYLLAWQLESDEKLEEARQQYERCLELNPTHHYARMKLMLLDLK